MVQFPHHSIHYFLNLTTLDKTPSYLITQGLTGIDVQLFSSIEHKEDKRAGI